MDSRIREALERGLNKSIYKGAPDATEHVIVNRWWRRWAIDLESNAREALALLDAPVASDAREVAVNDFRMDELDAVMISVDKWFDEGDPRLNNNPATRAADAREIALKAIEAAINREHKAREETARKCAEAAIKWQKKLCADDDWGCGACNECDDLERAILGAAHE